MWCIRRLLRCGEALIVVWLVAVRCGAAMGQLQCDEALIAARRGAPCSAMRRLLQCDEALIAVRCGAYCIVMWCVLQCDEARIALPRSPLRGELDTARRNAPHGGAAHGGAIWGPQ